MYPIHDTEVLLLLAMALSSKRRPAELVEIMAAIDLTHGSIPAELKLIEAFHRLSTHGLIGEEAGRFTLTPDGQKIMADQPRKKVDAEERVFGIKENLAMYNSNGEHAPILITAEQLGVAIRAHRTSAKGSGRNLLVPKPKAAEGSGPRGGPWRKPAAGRRRQT